MIEGSRDNPTFSIFCAVPKQKLFNSFFFFFQTHCYWCIVPKHVGGIPHADSGKNKKEEEEEEKKKKKKEEEEEEEEKEKENCKILWCKTGRLRTLSSHFGTLLLKVSI